MTMKTGLQVSFFELKICTDVDVRIGMRSTGASMGAHKKESLEIRRLKELILKIDAENIAWKK
jgi:hypothetical protein